MSTAVAEQPTLERKKTEGSSEAIDEKRPLDDASGSFHEEEAFDGHDV
jgi:hypothetical protein